MAERIVYDCDHCGKRNTETRRIVVVVDRVTDAAGSPENVCEQVDLCAVCMAGQLNKYLDGLTMLGRANWVKLVKQHG